jgi:hypothetical protein
LISDPIEASIRRFESLTGDRSIQVLCDPDWGGPSMGSLTIQPAPIDEINIVTLARTDCGRGNPLWAGTVIVRDSSFPGLDGMTGTIGGSDPSFFTVTFDPHYDQRLAAVWLNVFLVGDAEVFAKIEFALKPVKSPDGVRDTIVGHECIIPNRDAGSP